MSVLGTLRRQSIRKGLFGGSRAWLLVGGLAWSLRALQVALRTSPERVYRGELEVGQTLVITNRPAPPTRRQRRRTRKADRKAERRAERAARRASKRDR